MNKKQLQKELEDLRDEELEVKNIDTILEDEQIPKGCKVFNLQCSIMFVDVRGSTSMTLMNGSRDMTKIYKMLSKLVIKAVEENKGKVKDIAGDGFLCIFKNENKLASGANAINSAILINDCIKDCYNTIVESDWKITCGIGIMTGNVFMSKIGLRGKTKKSQVVYPSKITNGASKLCEKAEGNEIIFDKLTHDQIKDKKIKKKCKEKTENKYKVFKKLCSEIWLIRCDDNEK